LPEDGSRAGFQNIVFVVIEIEYICYTMNEVQKKNIVSACPLNVESSIEFIHIICIPQLKDVGHVVLRTQCNKI
jgi:hypothetical protein